MQHDRCSNMADMLTGNRSMAHYEHIASTKTTTALRETMLFLVEPRCVGAFEPRYIVRCVGAFEQSCHTLFKAILNKHRAT